MLCMTQTALARILHGYRAANPYLLRTILHKFFFAWSSSSSFLHQQTTVFYPLGQVMTAWRNQDLSLFVVVSATIPTTVPYAHQLTTWRNWGLFTVCGIWHIHMHNNSLSYYVVVHMDAPIATDSERALISSGFQSFLMVEDVGGLLL